MEQVRKIVHALLARWQQRMKAASIHPKLFVPCRVVYNSGSDPPLKPSLHLQEPSPAKRQHEHANQVVFNNSVSVREGQKNRKIISIDHVSIEAVRPDGP
jgi:hypothetical protein